MFKDNSERKPAAVWGRQDSTYQILFRPVVEIWLERKMTTGFKTEENPVPNLN